MPAILDLTTAISAYGNLLAVAKRSQPDALHRLLLEIQGRRPSLAAGPAAEAMRQDGLA